ncbi:MAG: hypothetical protein WAX77_00845 [Methylococcaceae bacterium]
MSSNYSDPKHTIVLIKKLLSYGFTNKAFVIIHHDTHKDNDESRLKAHLDHCAKITKFDTDGKNADVQKRLEIILNAFESGNFSKANEDIFIHLANAAIIEIPLR